MATKRAQRWAAYTRQRGHCHRCGAAMGIVFAYLGEPDDVAVCKTCCKTAATASESPPPAHESDTGEPSGGDSSESGESDDNDSDDEKSLAIIDDPPPPSYEEAMRTAAEADTLAPRLGALTLATATPGKKAITEWWQQSLAAGSLLGALQHTPLKRGCTVPKKAVHAAFANFSGCPTVCQAVVTRYVTHTQTVTAAAKTLNVIV